MERAFISCLKFDISFQEHPKLFPQKYINNIFVNIDLCDHNVQVDLNSTEQIRLNKMFHSWYFIFRERNPFLYPFLSSFLMLGVAIVSVLPLFKRKRAKFAVLWLFYVSPIWLKKYNFTKNTHIQIEIFRYGVSSWYHFVCTNNCYQIV